MQSLPLKLAPGSDLRLSLEQLASEQKLYGFVLGVVGNLSRACFQCPGQEQPSVLEGDLEVITLNGTFSPEGVHLHLSLSDGACQVWGGHLENGTLVQKGVDLLLGMIEPSSVQNPSAAAAQETSVQETSIAQPRLEIAVLPGCPWCARALRLLRTLDLPHRVETINGDDDFHRWQRRSGMTSFPQIFVDGQLIGGYDDLAAMHAKGQLALLR
ncbi:MAG: glutaredoxin [Cyanobium sp. NAT70]|nr:glutaredoxin [Cyanobium sp. NAT70]|tara:strand:+ start:1722 stop:2360 length:639 start_codon:yes stop_codon:yes gene_type:complete